MADAMRIGFIGAGRMATALAQGWIGAGLTQRESCIASDPVAAVREQFVAAKVLFDGPHNKARTEQQLRQREWYGPLASRKIFLSEVDQKHDRNCESHALTHTSRPSYQCAHDEA